MYLVQTRSGHRTNPEFKDKMASSARRRLDTIRYRIQRLKSTSLTDNIYSKDEPRLHTVFDLILVGLGTIFPFSLFVIAGHVVKDLAGPSAILSLIFAALASGFAGLSYSELRARVYRLQATAYEYTYRLIGEAVAFLIGWLLVLHHVMCTSAVARAISQNFDYLLENRISNLTIAHLGSVSGFDTYLDFVAFFISLLTMLGSVLDLTLDGRKVKLSCIGLTLITTLFVLVVGLYHLNFHRWQDVNSFFPHGIGGVMGGATVLSYAFWSSETILRSCDLNSRGLRKPAVTSILVVHIVTMIVLILTLSVMTLLSARWRTDTPLAESFTAAGMTWLRYLICPVAICVLWPALCHQYRHSVTSLCHLADDGLLPEALSARSPRTNWPLLAAVALGVVSSLCSLVFSVSYIIQVVAVPVVVVQILSSLATICFHYKPEDEGMAAANRRRRRRHANRSTLAPQQRNGAAGPASGEAPATSYGATIRTESERHGKPAGPEAAAVIQTEPADGATVDQTTADASAPAATTNSSNNLADGSSGSSSDTDIDDIVEQYNHERCVRQLTENVSPADYRKRSTKRSFGRVKMALVVFLFASAALGVLVSDSGSELKRHKVVVAVLVVTCSLVAFLSAAVIACQPRDVIQPYTVMMYVHHVPWTPLVALVMNVMMLCGIGSFSVVTTGIWIVLGMVVYLLYGMSHSHEALYPEDYPEEQRGLVGQPSTCQSRQSLNSASAPASGYTATRASDRDDDLLLDCT